jgi:hypothetical protein
VVDGLHFGDVITGPVKTLGDAFARHSRFQNCLGSTSLLQYIRNEPPFKILNFGCGPGRDLKTFAELGHIAIGLEGAVHLAVMARARPTCRRQLRDPTEKGPLFDQSGPSVPRGVTMQFEVTRKDRGWKAPNYDHEFPIGPALKAYLARIAADLNVEPERRSFRRWVFVEEARDHYHHDKVVVTVDAKTHTVRCKSDNPDHQPKPDEVEAIEAEKPPILILPDDGGWPASVPARPLPITAKLS